MLRGFLAAWLTAPLAALAIPPATPWQAADLVAVVQPITTEIRFADGALQRNRGSGFVIGDRYYTAYHNLQAAPGIIVEQRILLAGQEVTPAAVDVGHDLAVFVVPASVCRSWCNGLALNEDGLGVERVMWLSGSGAEAHWQRARVRNLAFKAAPVAHHDAGCDADLIVEIDAPFVPGDSGGPVFDPGSGRVVGLIQGSFEDRAGRTTGYFKPAACVRARLNRP